MAGLDVLVVALHHQHDLGVQVRGGEAVLLGPLLGVAHAVAGDVKATGVHARQYGVPVGLLEVGLHAQAPGDQRADLHVQAGENVVFIVIGPGLPVALGGDHQRAPLPDAGEQVGGFGMGDDGQGQRQQQRDAKQLFHGISSLKGVVGPSREGPGSARPVGRRSHHTT